MFEKKRTLRYQSREDSYSGEIQPAKSLIPEWYPQTPRWVEINKLKHPGLKHCIPFLDTLTTGYLLVLPQDIYVQREEAGPVIRYKHEINGLGPIADRPAQVTDPAPIPHGYHDIHFIWTTQIAVKPPTGYSLLYTHPLNRFDLPFLTMSGIVDDYAMPGANISFFLKEGFEGEILAGTPVAQIIPFLREDWELKVDKSLWEEAESNIRPQEVLTDGFYRKNFWKKKSYK